MSSYRRSKRSGGEDAPKTIGVHYLRVSTAKQTHTGSDLDPLGNSIATQQEECDRLASANGVTIQRVFIEPGKSATTIDKRPVFREMMAYLAEHPEVGFIYIYARTRAFRNLKDAVVTRNHLQLMGVRLVSVSEDFPDTIEGELMANVSDSVNEYGNKKSAQDIKTKMARAARSGRTIGRAPLGYLNTRKNVNGHLVNTVVIDEERGPLLRIAFELYATGDYTIEALKEVLDDQGLTSPRTNRWPERRPVSTNTLSRVLTDPYYAGYTVYDGELFPGRHEPLVSQQLFDAVQDAFDARSTADSRQRTLHHYLKGLLRCDRCHQAGRDYRLIYTEATGRSGTRYGYYLCRGRQEGECDLPHLAVARVERAIEDHISASRLPASFTDTIDSELATVLEHEQSAVAQLHANLTKELETLDSRENRLLDAIEDASIPRGKIRERLAGITQQRASIQERLTDTSANLALGASALRDALKLCRDADTLYGHTNDQSRTLILQALFVTLYIDEHAQVAETVPTAIVRDTLDAHEQHQAAGVPSGSSDPAPTTKHGPRRSGDRDGPSLSNLFRGIDPATGSSRKVLVELRGFEPLTPSMPWRCATNCATAPFRVVPRAETGPSNLRNLNRRPARTQIAASTSGAAIRCAGNPPQTTGDAAQSRREYRHLARRPRRAGRADGRPEDTAGRRRLANPVALRGLDRPRCACAHDRDRLHHADQLCHRPGQGRLQLQPLPRRRHRAHQGHQPAGDARQLRGAAELHFLAPRPQAELAGRSDRARGGHPPPPRAAARLSNRGARHAGRLLQGLQHAHRRQEPHRRPRPARHRHHVEPRSRAGRRGSDPRARHGHGRAHRLSRPADRPGRGATSQPLTPARRKVGRLGASKEARGAR